MSNFNPVSDSNNTDSKQVFITGAVVAVGKSKLLTLILMSASNTRHAHTVLLGCVITTVSLLVCMYKYHFQSSHVNQQSLPSSMHIATSLITFYILCAYTHKKKVLLKCKGVKHIK